MKSPLKSPLKAENEKFALTTTGRPYLSNREEKLLRGSTDTSSVPAVDAQRQSWDRGVRFSPQRADIFSKPKVSYTSPNSKKRPEIALNSSQERSYEESPGKAMERKRNALNRPFVSKIDRRHFVKKQVSIASCQDSTMVSSIASSATKQVPKAPMKSIIKMDSDVSKKSTPKLSDKAKKVRFDDMMTLGLCSGDVQADHDFLDSEEVSISAKKSAPGKFNFSSKGSKNKKNAPSPSVKKDPLIVEGKRKRLQASK